MQDLTETTAKNEIEDEIYQGLNHAVKYISSRFLYDEKGSELFEQITKLPAYYLPRIEKALLKKQAKILLKSTNCTDIIELGSGDCSKISILLNAIEESEITNYCYYPVDISQSAIKKSSQILRQQYYQLQVKGFVADFMKHINSLPGIPGNRLLLFFGSTIGNLTRKQALNFMAKLQHLMAPGDYFLVGFDRVKDVRVLEDAYNDSQGVTAAFNKNLLNVINEYAQTNFNKDDFDHFAYYNQELQRIEMHLKARKNLTISSPRFEQSLLFKKGETIHTENSHKFTGTRIQELAENTGFKLSAFISDNAQWFSLGLFQK